jgi:2-polyprenyl-3-methyl-5-hydroxy-6-metoxy-1,4-benzoquinol methylase
MACLLCGSDQYEVFDHVESFGFPLVYHQCAACGLIFQSSQGSQAADPAFYAETYRQIYQSTDEPTIKDLWVQEHRALSLVKILQSLKVDSPARILDIGASTGVLMGAFQNAFGADVVGVEPGDAYRQYAEEQGMTMFSSVEELLASNPPRFDLISMIHVLEHLPDPVGMLRMIRTDLLKDSGILLLEVPNFYAHDSYELAHLACYTPHTLQTVLRQAGYHVFFFHRHGFPRSSLLNLYLTLLAQPLPPDAPQPPITRDRMVQFKRSAGWVYRRAVQKLFPQKAWLPLPNEKDG